MGIPDNFDPRRETGIAMEPDTVPVERALREMAQSLRRGQHAIAVGRLATYAGAPIFPGEALACNRAHPRRRLAFRAGRACAREALAGLGLPARSIAVGAAGEPIWPNGLTGSISHTNEIVAAVVARNPPVAGLGLDLEPDEPLSSVEVMEVVCRPEELARRRGLLDPIDLKRGKLLFVVKEALYKLYWPLTGARADFHDFRVALDGVAGVFRAELTNPQLPPIAGSRVFAGRFAQCHGLFMALAAVSAGCAMPAGPAPS